MRKKKAALIIKSLLIFLALGIALYFSDSDQNSENFLSMHDGAKDHYYNQSNGAIVTNNPFNFGSSKVPFPKNQNNADHVGTTSENNGASELLKPFHTNHEIESNNSNDEALAITATTTTNTYLDGPGGLNYLSMPVITPPTPAKTKKESKNSFGSTIASSKTGIGNAGLENVDMPMAPPPPEDEVPLDGGSIIVLILGIGIAVYKLFLRPSITVKTTND